jgi:hypothetical protein
MDTIVVVTTHHKTGTVWANQIFKRIGAALDIPVAISRRDQGATPLVAPVIVCTSEYSFESSYPGASLSRDDVRIMHMIRDPRDVCISGMHYHLRSKEKRLHVKKARYGHRTYQTALRGFRTTRRRLHFEIEFSLAKNLENMLQWDYTRPNAYEVKYEDLIVDYDGELFRKIVTRLELPQPELCLQAFQDASLFGGKVEGQKVHVRSGKPAQWLSVFDQRLARKFLKTFGPALITLGYEKDDSWVERLPAVNPALDATAENPPRQKRRKDKEKAKAKAAAKAA